LLLRLTEARPDFAANLRFSQITKDGTRIVNLVCQRHPKGVLIGIVEMREVGFSSLSGGRFALPFPLIGETIRAGFDDPSYALAEAITNVLEPAVPL
jgi:hypothetical protein